MSRQLRIQYQGAYYHVTGRGNERRDIFKDKDDYLMFLEKLSDSLEVYNVSLLGYVCMTNHFHLLVMTPSGNLSSFMRHFNIAYTSSFNRRHNRSGHLYQGRYKSYLVDADSYLKEVSRYIHLNPVRIKKNSEMDMNQRITILNGFVYSSFAGYSNMKKRDGFIHYNTVLDYFGGDTKAGRTAYRQFVYQGLTHEIASPLEIGKGNGIIGSEEFITRVKDKYLVKIDPESHREQPHLKEIRSAFTPEKLIDAFCTLTGNDRNDICRRCINSIERSMLMELLYRFCNIKQPEIGRYLGNIDYSAVSISRKRLRLKMEKDGVLKQRFDGIVEGLSGVRA
ncbi:MAG: transposase [Desulfobacteraceae bacterium]|jgi:REP element-mobilizing transposase RayT